MIQLPENYKLLPGYNDDMEYASRIDNNREFFFVSRWFPVELMGIKIRQFTVKDYLTLSAEKSDILTERFNFSDCVKFMYLLHYNRTESIVLRSIREYRLGKKLIKYIVKTYPGCDIEEKIGSVIREYWDNIMNDFPSRNIPMLLDGKEASYNNSYNGYGWSFMLFKMMKELNFTEEQLLNLPVHVFFEYYQVILSSNKDYTRSGRTDFVEKSYMIKFEKIKKILKD